MAAVGNHPGDLMDQVEKLRTLLPEFAKESAVARREVARLRSENAKLRRRVTELEARSGNTASQRRATPASD